VSTLLGVQVLWYHPEVKVFLEAARPRLVKWIDFTPSGIAGLRAYRSLVPDCTVIGRVLDEGNLAAEINRLQPLGLVDYWELWNVPGGTSREETRAINARTLALLGQLAPTVRPLVGVFAEGNPSELAFWDEFYPSLREAKAHGGGLALHEYDAPSMKQSVERRPDGTVTYWRCGRFREVWARLPSDLQDILFVVTECGIDFGVDHTKEGLPRFPDQGFLERVPEADFVGDLEWYDGLLHLPGPRVLGGTLFVLGATWQWVRFELARAILVRDYLARHQGPLAIGLPLKSTPEVKKPMRLHVAVSPSNQDRNPVTGGGNEMTQVRPFALLLVSELNAYLDVTARLIDAAPESSDRKDHPYEGLIAQQDAAFAALEPNQSGNVTLSLSLHTDSGSSSTCGFYFDGAGSVSERLGAYLGGTLSAFFGTPAHSADYSGYIFATRLKHRHCPLLLECGSHQNAHDVALLRERGDELSRLLAAAIVDFFAASFGLGTARRVLVQVSPERDYFHDWAKLVHRNDPEGVDSEYAPGKFAAHLRAIGKPLDGAHPLNYYGAPPGLA